MKRESILFYLKSNKIYFYLMNSKKEYVECLDTSLFFKYGEISNVRLCIEAITKLVEKMNLGLYYLKPNITVLYNDVCYADAKFIYRSVLDTIGYNKIDFVPITKLAAKIKDDKNVVISDGDYYILVKSRRRVDSLNSLDWDPVVIGSVDDKYVHFADEEIIYKTFKSCFTKGGNYDIMVVGDDEC